MRRAADETLFIGVHHVVVEPVDRAHVAEGIAVSCQQDAPRQNGTDGQLLGNFRLFGFVGYFDLPLELHLRHTRVFVQFLLNCLLLFPGERTRQLFLRRILKVIGKRQLAALFHIEVNVSVQSTRSTEA